MRGYEFLDKELQKAMLDVEIGCRYTVKVWRKDGQESWVIVHIEVQSQVDASFSERMFVYHYRQISHFR